MTPGHNEHAQASVNVRAVYGKKGVLRAGLESIDRSTFGIAGEQDRILELTRKSDAAAGDKPSSEPYFEAKAGAAPPLFSVLER
jgi:hypothetical protein